MDDMVRYLEANLRIYTKADGKIDYLSLKHDATIPIRNSASIRNSSVDDLQRVRGYLVGGTSNQASSIRNSSVDGDSIRQSNSIR